MAKNGFPILDCPGTCVPWSAVDPHAEQAVKNHSQPLMALASRGGLTACEMVAVLEGRAWRRMDHDEARRRLIELAGLA